MLPTMRRHGITLAVFALIAVGTVVVVNLLTADRIAEQTKQQQKILLNQVLPSNLYNNDPLKECVMVTDPALLGSAVPHKAYLARLDGKPVALAIESTAPNGYSGAIQLMVGTTLSGESLGVRVLEHHETPGLGDKIDLRISDWILSFKDKVLHDDNDPRWAVRKDGGMFDQFTGATITPRAVVGGVKNTLIYVRHHGQALFTQQPDCGE
ncbi:electron transport complex subunit RsxG [Plesiomonas shigelloides]|uniref:electron transport complex subunit RsxG n=1 Tax=Plesiomonas shigelloides TaxID=703 RepID=UPI00267590CD|nr:electron transport complex subunit RsxG [Plesiomonas shigelloides]